MADLVIRCHERDLALSLELAADLAVLRMLVCLDGREEVGSLRLQLSKRRLGVQGICLDQHLVQIQLTEKLPQHRPHVVFAGGVAGLADRHAQGGAVEHHLGDECRTAAYSGLDRAPQRLAITH